MDTANRTSESFYYSPNGVKLRRRTFGKKPVSAPFAVPTDLTAASRMPFALRWEDAPAGLSATVTENDAGRMIATVTAKGNTRFSAMSVALVGNVENEWRGKTIKLARTSDTEEHGTADFGSLADLAKSLGDSWVLVVFPVL